MNERYIISHFRDFVNSRTYDIILLHINQLLFYVTRKNAISIVKGGLAT